MYSDDILQKAKKVKLLAMDVDGVLTDGKIIYDSQGIESKEFFVQDGLGLALLRKSGVGLAIITGRNSPMVERRANELGIEHIIQGRDDKAVALGELLGELDLDFDECAYVGDDLPDVGAIKQAGLGVTVANGCELAKQTTDYTTTKTGGNGAVREVCELILTAQGHWQGILDKYL